MTGKIYWNHFEQWPIPVGGPPLGVLENADGDVVGFIVVEPIGPDVMQVVCRRTWEEFSYGAQVKLPDSIEEAAREVVRGLFEKELEAW